MGSEFKVYDLSEVSVIFAGLPIDSGLGEGNITVEQLSPDFTTKEGNDGSVTRSKTGKRLTRVTIPLLQTSSGNAILSTLNNIDRLAANGAAVGPFLMRDRQGLSLIAGPHAWIEGPPKVEYGAEATDRPWVIMIADPERFDGGN